MIKVLPIFQWFLECEIDREIISLAMDVQINDKNLIQPNLDEAFIYV